MELMVNIRGITQQRPARGSAGGGSNQRQGSVPSEGTAYSNLGRAN